MSEYPARHISGVTPTAVNLLHDVVVTEESETVESTVLPNYFLASPTAVPISTGEYYYKYEFVNNRFPQDFAASPSSDPNTTVSIFGRELQCTLNTGALGGSQAAAGGFRERIASPLLYEFEGKLDAHIPFVFQSFACVFSPQNLFAFSYDFLSSGGFSIIYQYGGVNPVISLLITTAPNALQNITFTLNGTNYVFQIGAQTTTAQTAARISEFVFESNGSVDWVVISEQSTVYFEKTSAAATSGYAFASDGNMTATFTEHDLGTTRTNVILSRTNWSHYLAHKSFLESFSPTQYHRCAIYISDMLNQILFMLWDNTINSYRVVHHLNTREYTTERISFLKTVSFVANILPFAYSGPQLSIFTRYARALRNRAANTDLYPKLATSVLLVALAAAEGTKTIVAFAQNPIIYNNDNIPAFLPIEVILNQIEIIVSDAATSQQISASIYSNSTRTGNAARFEYADNSSGLMIAYNQPMNYTHDGDLLVQRLRSGSGSLLMLDSPITIHWGNKNIFLTTSISSGNCSISVVLNYSAV